MGEEAAVLGVWQQENGTKNFHTPHKQQSF